MKQPADSQKTMMIAANEEAWQSLRERIKSIEISAELLWLDALQNLTESQVLRAKNTHFKEDSIMENMQRYCQTFKSAAERDALNVNALISRIAEAGYQLYRDQTVQSL
jgi:endonuclease III